MGATGVVKGDQASMSKVKMIVSMFIAVLAFSAIASASASAATAGWMVNGTLLTGSAALATTAPSEETAVLNGAGLNIECKGPLNGLKPEIKSSNKGAATLTFTVCSTKNGECEVPAEISTAPVLAEVTLEGALAVSAKFTPETGTLFSTVKFSGAKCAVAGNKPITGKVIAKGPTGQDERAVQELTVNVTEGAGELFIASSAASLKGAALLKLQSGQTWSFL
jgi:hypothetical protein